MIRYPINVVLLSVLLASCLAPRNSAADPLLITNVRLHADPASPPIPQVNILINDGIIQELSTRPIDFDAEVIDGRGRTATAGLWNSHVHFTQPELQEDPQRHLTTMLLQYGFTSVVDTGSDLAQTLELSRQIDLGELRGPRIVTANGSFVHTDGTPSYLPGVQLPEITTREEAIRQTAEVLESGADGIKIFSGSYQGEADTIHLPAEIINAISSEAHRRGTFVISHPQDLIGLTNAVENGVDVLAHTAPGAGPLGKTLITRIVDRNIALVPTLSLWDFVLRQQQLPEDVIQSVQERAISQLRAVHSAGGEVLFGTDVGFVREFDTTKEYELMYRAGMSFQDILQSLTTAPANRFSEHSGRVAVGVPADIVIFTDDPAKNVRNFSRIDYTIRNGVVLFERG